MIPKVIHYCWFGGKPLPELTKKCMASWKKHCPDYEIKEWNEKNFDLNCCDYVKEAYEAKKWAFIADYVRLYALVTEGGIYMDTDVEVVSSLDGFLTNEAFCGFEDDVHLSTGIMAGKKNFILFREMLNDYDKRHFIKEKGFLDITTNVVVFTKLCEEHGYVANNKKQNICGLTIYPKDVFSPKSCETGKINQTKNTAVIHHFSGSWWSLEGRIAEGIKRNTKSKGRVICIAGKVIAFPFTYIARAKTEGQKATLAYYWKKIRR